jgi:hypothetical protein
MRTARFAFAAVLAVLAVPASASTLPRANPCQDALMSQVRAEREKAVQEGVIDRLGVYLAEPLVSIEPDCNALQMKPVFTFTTEWVEEPQAPAPVSQLRR